IECSVAVDPAAFTARRGDAAVQRLAELSDDIGTTRARISDRVAEIVGHRRHFAVPCLDPSEARFFLALRDAAVICPVRPLRNIYTTDESEMPPGSSDVRC